MTPHDPPDHSDLWRQVAAAADYAAATTRPGFTVWDALDEAVQTWIAAPFDERPCPCPPWIDPDSLRASIASVLATSAPSGCPGGQRVGDLLAGALATWVQDIAIEINDGYPFAQSAL